MELLPRIANFKILMHWGNSFFNQVKEWRLLELQYKISVLKEMPCGHQIRTKKIFVSKEIKS